MITTQGKGVSGGIAVGPVYVFQPARRTVTKTIAEPDTESARLDEARFAVMRQLEDLAEACRNESEEAAILLQTHAMFVEDEDFTACMYSILEMERCNAEYAVEQAGAQFAAMFAAMDDPYMQERAADIRDVTDRILDALGDGGSGPVLTQPVILFADDLSPSDTLRLDRKNLLGFVTRKGSPTAHTAILARSLGIPAVCCAKDALSCDVSGQLCCMDGDTGDICIDPDPETLAVWEEKIRGRQEDQAVKELPDVTADGRSLKLFCNIGSPDDIPAVLACGAGGIGLFRSEFLFLGRGDPPSEEEQFEAYRTVVSAMDGKQVIIRTLDVGADKQATYLALKKEANPALGVRGIRLCLAYPDLFETQLRALYRASAYGNLAVMFPMVTSVWEVRACRQLCEKVMAQLEQENIPFDRDMKLGVMIETPAAALIAEDLAQESDFFSVGTNDLTQYTLACDRQAGDLGRFCDPHHPAVLRSIRLAAEAAHAAGIPIGICGELAGDTELLPLFLELEIDELSVAPARVLPLRATIRDIST